MILLPSAKNALAFQRDVKTDSPAEVPFLGTMKHIPKLTPFEIGLLSLSLVTVILSSLLSNAGILNALASAVGVIALIFVAKGLPIGQLFTVFFSILYALVAWKFRYWGEMITYLGMSMPIALFSFLSWIRHPYEKGTGEVKIATLTKGKTIALLFLTVGVTVLFYVPLNYFETPNLAVSTLSVTTSFLAASLLYLRSPLYALSYAANDVVLIVLWTMAAIEDFTFLPMIACFVAFFANDLYGFFNWMRMKNKQKSP